MHLGTRSALRAMAVAGRAGVRVNLSPCISRFGMIPRSNSANSALMRELPLSRTVSTLVNKPEHPEDESVMEGGTPLVHLTERAVEKIRSVAEGENDPKVALRIIVEPGGCHGYMYKLEITNEYGDDDLYVSSLTTVSSMTMVLALSLTVSLSASSKEAQLIM